MLDRYLERCRSASVDAPEGVVLNVVGLIVEVGGLRAAIGDALMVETSHDSWLPVEVVGFRAGRLLTTPLGTLSGVRPGARAMPSGKGATIGVGNQLLGRVVDPFGLPLDGGPPIACERRWAVHGSPPPAFSRRPIDQPFGSGVRAIDGLVPLGLGQRLGIFAGAGVGKSTLLGIICRGSQADVNVVGLVGERGRELNDFVRGSLGKEGLAKSVVVTATSDQPPVVRVRGAESATAIAEYFRQQGKSVLLVMDSVTRYAMALRETALAAGEPPATKGYPPSVFAALPRLLERAGTSGGAGVITALYTVLVEGDDLSDPVADAVRSILDGHVVLSRSLAEKGHFPAIDPLASVSRVAHEVTPTPVQRAGNVVRDLMGAYREAQDLIQIGAYVRGSDARVDAACAAMPQINAFLRQASNESFRLEEIQARLVALAFQFERSLRA